MKWLFDVDNPVMHALSIVGDLILLNLLTIACCLPLVTVGAALTALNAAVIKLIRGEESTTGKDYLRAFRDNFKKSCAMGLLFLLICALLFADYLAAQAYIPALCPVIAAIALLVLMLGQYAFALLARYENTLLGTLKNALLLAVGYFPRTVGMVVFTMTLWILAIQYFFYGAPILFLVGFSLPCYVVILLVQPVFANLESPKR